MPFLSTGYVQALCQAFYRISSSHACDIAAGEVSLSTFNG